MRKFVLLSLRMEFEIWLMTDNDGDGYFGCKKEISFNTQRAAVKDRN